MNRLNSSGWTTPSVSLNTRCLGYDDGIIFLPQLHAMLRNGAKIVMTSRDYIYNRARKDLKESAFPLLNESRVVIDVRDLSDDDKGTDALQSYQARNSTPVISGEDQALSSECCRP